MLDYRVRKLVTEIVPLSGDKAMQLAPDRSGALVVHVVQAINDNRELRKATKTSRRRDVDIDGLGPGGLQYYLRYHQKSRQNYRWSVRGSSEICQNGTSD